MLGKIGSPTWTKRAGLRAKFPNFRGKVAPGPSTAIRLVLENNSHFVAQMKAVWSAVSRTKTCFSNSVLNGIIVTSWDIRCLCAVSLTGRSWRRFVRQALQRIHRFAEVSPIPLLHCFLGILELRPRLAQFRLRAGRLSGNLGLLRPEDGLDGFIEGWLHRHLVPRGVKTERSAARAPGNGTASGPIPLRARL